MPKQNSAILLNKYIWLVDTIYSAGHISREEIDRRWCRSLLSEDEMSIPPRTFHRWRIAIEELFQISIEFNKIKGYYIEDRSDIERHSMRKWLINTFAVNNLINEGEHLRKHISFEEMPSGQRFLTTILESIRDRVALRVTHRGFNKPEPTPFMLKPYGLKVFKQRWYVFGVKCEEGEPLVVNASSVTRIYALDRVKSLETSEHTFKMPKKFDAPTYFSQYYGVFCGPDYKPEIIRARFGEKDAPYVRTLPLHHSQKEVEPNVFEWYVAPTFDFIQQLRTYSFTVEILAPKFLRDKFAEDARKVLELYR